MTDAAVNKLSQFLERYRKNGPHPILWVGAGASAAAGYPTLGQLEELVRKELPGETATGFELIDRYIGEYSKADLANFLQQHLGVPNGPAPIHEAIARLAQAAVLGPLFTTNYDRLIEEALRTLEVAHTVQVLEQNFVLQARQDVQLLKLHGDQGDWLSVVLSAASYAAFEQSNPLLRQQLDLSLRIRPVVFVGCSLRDPRVLGWLRSLSDSERDRLFASRVLITTRDWAQIPAEDQALLRQSNVQPILVDDHAAVTRTMQEVARRLAPLAAQELVFVIAPTDAEWTVVGPTAESEPHRAANPLKDAAFVAKLVQLRAQAPLSINEDHPAAAAQEAQARLLASELGAKLTALLLSDSAKQQVTRRIHDKDRGRARLILRVHNTHDAQQRALTEQALALPWELLMPESGAFAVERSDLDVVREIVTQGAPELPPPTGPLSVAATIAAPEDQTALKYEEEALRLQQALLPLGHGIAFAEMGTITDLVSLAEKMEPQAIHFSGHGEPGQLVFEDKLGCSQKVSVDELVSRLNNRLAQAGMQKRFPRLFFLASCHGLSGMASANAVEGTRSAEERQSRDLGAALGEGPSTAAALHRAGFAQVLGYFGPVGDSLCTRAEEVFYGALAQGKTTLQATSECRQALREPLQSGEQKIRYPLAWVQLALYHRGPDHALALPGSTQAMPPQWRDKISVSGLPCLANGFIGRRALQHLVRRRVHAGQRLLLLYGLGGVGKTALATQLLRNVLAHDDHDLLILRCDEVRDDAEPAHKLWARAEQRAIELGVFPEALKSIRESTEDPAKGFALTVELLRKRRPRLVVYADNMEDLQVAPKDVEAALPLGTWRPGIEPWWKAMEHLSEKGLVLASMRYRFDGPAEEAWVSVAPMRPSDTQRLVDTFAGLKTLTDVSKQQLVARCEGHPRTVEFLDTLIRQHRKRSIGSPSVIESVLEQLLSKVSTDITDNLVLSELWDCLSASAQQHALKLSVLRQPVPTEVAEAVGSGCVELRDSSLLIDFPLLRIDNGKPVWRARWGMLGVVSAFVRAKLSKPQRETAHRAVGVALKSHVEGVSEDRRWVDQEEALHHLHQAGEGDLAWPLVSEYVIHLRARAQYSEALTLLDCCEAGQTTGDRLAIALTFSSQILGLLGRHTADAAARLERAASLAETDSTHTFVLSEQGSVLSSQGKYSEAESLLRRSLTLNEKALGSEHPSFGASLHALAGVLESQGKYSEAESLLRRSLTLVEKALGSEHPSFGASLHALAGVLSQQGKYSEAESLLRRSLTLVEKALGSEHPSFGASLHALAGVLSQQGKYSEAESLLRRSLTLAEKALGSEHPSFGASLHALAGVLESQGKYSEAESLLRCSLTLVEKALGSEHPSFGASLHALAGVLSKQGKYSEAESLLRRSLTLNEKALGSEHPSFGASLHALAGVLESQGKYSEAESLLRRSLTIDEKALGSEHPSFGASLHALAGVLESQGKYSEAESLLRRSLTLKEKALGSEHPSFGASLHALAGVLSQQGKYSEAESLLRRSLTLVEKALGSEHPSFGASLHALAGVLSKQGKYSEAESLLRRSLTIDEKALGSEHPSFGASLHALAGVLESQGKYSEAESLLRCSLTLAEKALGSEHPSFGASLHALAGVLSQQGKYSEAESLLRCSLTLAEKALGSEHPSFGASLHALAGVLSKQGKYSEAESLLRRSLTLKEKALGSEHPSFGASLHALAGVLESQGKYSEAESLLRRSLTLVEKALGSEHPSFGASLHALAGVLESQGKYSEAESLLRCSLTLVEKVLGSEHPSFGASLHVLAGVLSQQGKYSEAESLLRRSLTLVEKALGSEHPSFGASLHALAGVLESQGKYSEAESLLRRSLTLKEKALGSEHPSFGASLHALAGVLESQGKYSEAESLLRRSLTIDEKALGSEHPSFGASLHALAGVLSQQGKYAEAESLLRRSLTIDEKALGSEHPSFGASLHALAGVLSKQGKYAEAESLLRRSLTLNEKALGSEHPSFGASLHALAGVLSQQGKYAEAESLLRRSLTLVEKALGSEHPSFGASLHALAGVLESQGKYSEAESLLRCSLTLVEKALGSEHPSFGASLHVLAGVLSQQGKYSEAESLLRRSLTIDEKALGSEHPSFGASLHALAGVLESQGKYSEAESLLRCSLTLAEKALGSEHPSFGASLHALAGVLSQQGKYSEAESLLRRSLTLKEKALGSEHPSFGASLHALAGVLSQQGKYSEAESLLRRSLTLKEKALGSEHPSLCPTLTNLGLVLAQMGQVEPATLLVARAYTLAQLTHGALHPDVGHILLVLAQLQAQQALPEAVGTAEQAVATLRSCLGPQHPATQNAIRFHAKLLGSSGAKTS